jgi:outer membrane autotransporter protein
MARAYGQRAKATVLAAPVAAQLGGYLTQINSYDQAFMNMDMNMTKTLEERQAEMSTKFAYQAGSDVKLAYSPQFDNGVSTNGKGLWTRPYATFERVNLSNGQKVGNIAYGNFFGGDADLKDMRNGWKRQFSAYIGYNGSVQDFDRQSIDQNGGTIGITEVWYKNNFFTGLTVNVGANAVNASTDIGHENFPMLMAGVASKTGYNFEFKRGRFIIQPSLLLSYSFVHTFSHNNGRGSHVGSSPLNAIQVAPGLKFIANLPKGWQPYIGINMRWNIMDKTHFSLPDVNIPDMSVDPYVEYGVGLQRKWGDRFTGFGQAMIRNGGRNGIMLSFGFKWALGK